MCRPPGSSDRPNRRFSSSTLAPRSGVAYTRWSITKHSPKVTAWSAGPAGVRRLVQAEPEALIVGAHGEPAELAARPRLVGHATEVDHPLHRGVEVGHREEDQHDPVLVVGVHADLDRRCPEQIVVTGHRRDAPTEQL